MNWIMKHKILFLVAAVLIAGGVWFGLSRPDPAPLLTSQSVGGAGGGADQQLVGSLLTLRAVTLNGTIFSNQAFARLRDFGTTIVPEPVGRENPFQPIGQTSASAASQDISITPTR
jgi:hypothetical protein